MCLAIRTARVLPQTKNVHGNMLTRKKRVVVVWVCVCVCAYTRTCACVVRVSVHVCVFTEGSAVRQGACCIASVFSGAPPGDVECSAASRTSVRRSSAVAALSRSSSAAASPCSSTASSSPGGASRRAAATKFQSSGAPWKYPCSPWPRHMAVSEKTLSTWGRVSRRNMAVMSSVFFESIAGDSITER
jgi:hypothetical protein